MCIRDSPVLQNAWYVRRRYAIIQIEAGKATDDDYDDNWMRKGGHKGRPIGTGRGSKYTEQEKKERGRMAARKSRALLKINAGRKTRDDYDDEWNMLNKSKPWTNVPTKTKTKKKKTVIIVIPDFDDLPPPPPEWILDMDDDAVLNQ